MLNVRVAVVLTALSLVLSPFVAAAAQFSMADIVGIWENNALASGPGAPWWLRGPVTFSADGSWSAVFEEYPGHPQTNSGTFTISADGTVLGSWRDDSGVAETMTCNMDMGKTVMVCTQTWLGWMPGTTQIAVLTKKGPSYGMADLVGTYGVNETASGPGAPSWQYGSITVAGDGSFSGTVQQYDASPDHVSGVLSISTDGIVTVPSVPEDHQAMCSMDSGKTVIACTATWVTGSPGTSEIFVFTKKAPLYSQADVSGIWAYHSLVSGGPYAPGWYRGKCTIDSSGLATCTVTDNTGAKETFTKSLIIAPDGSFSGLGGGGNMDADKTVIVLTITETNGNGTVEMPVLVKTSSVTSCPSLYAWNENDYERESFIFPGASPRANEYVDHIPLKQLVPQDGYYYLQIRETEQENSFINKAKLIVVDHNSDVNMTDLFVHRETESIPHPSPSEVWYKNAIALDTLRGKANFIILSPISATHSMIGDVLPQLYSSDDQYVHTNPGDIITLTFSALPLKEGEIRDFIFAGEGFYVPLNEK